MSSSKVPPAVFNILATLVEETLGLYYSSADAELFVERVRGRATEAGFDSLLDYYYFLRYDAAAGAELLELADSLVVGETYFFRELAPLQFIVNHILAPAVKTGRRPKVWCAACATGEEPLTLAMLLAQQNLLSSTTIIASDISQRALARARSGKFSRRALRNIPDGAPLGWISETPNGQLSVSPELINAIDWRQINLCEANPAKAVGRCDVILCRNVLIYFREGTVSQVIDHFANALIPDGSLFVGISESLLRFGTSLRCEESAGIFYYRKPL